MMIRTSIAAVAVTLAAVAPSFADGYGYGYDGYGYGGYGYGEHRYAGPAPYAAPAYEDTTNRLVVDPYSGRVTFDQRVADPCWPRHRSGGWSYSYSRRVPDYGY